VHAERRAKRATLLSATRWAFSTARNVYTLWQFCECHGEERSRPMHGLIYLIGLIVVVLAILSFFGLR
jgi:hypothetical protein